MDRSLMAQAQERVGVRQASKALAYMRNWALARDALGHPPTALEYAAHWKVHERTAWRDRAAFAAAFPSEHDPGRLLDAARQERLRAEVDDLLDLGNVRLS